MHKAATYPKKPMHPIAKQPSRKTAATSYKKELLMKLHRKIILGHGDVAKRKYALILESKLY
jgi:hypothetical protein